MALLGEFLTDPGISLQRRDLLKAEIFTFSTAKVNYSAKCLVFKGVFLENATLAYPCSEERFYGEAAIGCKE